MPFVRLIIPLIFGIIIQFYSPFSLLSLIFFLLIPIIFLLGFSFLPLRYKYALRWIQGFLINMILLTAGAFIVFKQDIKNNRLWVGHAGTDSFAVMATLQEPLVEKAKSYKAVATIDAINKNGSWQKATGKILIYFGKDSIHRPSLDYGDQFVFNKPLQLIRNAGNPGSFDYRQFNAFKDIYHQRFLKSNEYFRVSSPQTNNFQAWLFRLRSSVIKLLQQYIQGDKEAGVAEALLIGYRDDLDKDLVQAYSNTGVVHIIAISGLHLGMIYVVLVFFFRPFHSKSWAKWLKPLVILTVLWVFSLLAGGVPSILRSAVMFSFIILGETINRKSSIYNTLATSAFVMLCYNPFYLWDIGFQLSYAAVISIIAFSKSVYHLLFVENKILDFFWNLMSVTLSAQILTLPIIFYSFHQFPNLFLITNCLIVPLSTIALFAELIVLIFSPLTSVANFCGLFTGGILRFMNSFIEEMSSYRYAVTDQIRFSLVETILLYLFIIFIAIWLMNRNRLALLSGSFVLFFLIGIDGYYTLKKRQQQKVIVYNVPKQTAIDFISGAYFSFVGDNVLRQDGYLRNFHLKPARTNYQAIKEMPIKGLFVSLPFIQFNGARILLLDKPYKFEHENKIPLQAIVISKNPRLKIADIARTFDCKQYILDGSNSKYKINKWKRECDSLHLPCLITNEEGAFELNL